MLVSKFLLIYQIVIETLSRDLFGKLIKKKTWTPTFIQIKTPLQIITPIRNPVTEARSLWGLWVPVHTRFFWFVLFFFWALQTSLVGGGLTLNMILSLLPYCWDISFALRHEVSFLVRCNILLSTVVQQWVAILEFSQEKMSTWPSSPLSLSYLSNHRKLTKLITWITALCNSM